jgi:hypothetical protein
MATKKSRAAEAETEVGLQMYALPRSKLERRAQRPQKKSRRERERIGVYSEITSEPCDKKPTSS